MRKTFSLILAVVAPGLLAGCPDNKAGGAASTGAAETTTSAATAAPTSTATAQTTVAATAATTAPTATATAAADTSATSSAAVAPTGAPSGSAAAGAKTYDCGAKGQKPCPMQGWMKSVMGSAVSSGDKDKLASAFAYVASHPPPGYGNWTTISKAGEAKAKAGDIDAAKKTCEQCHSAYKAKYKADMRDRPF